MKTKKQSNFFSNILVLILCILLFIFFGAVSNIKAENQTKSEVENQIENQAESEIESEIEKKVLFISSYSYSWSTVPHQMEGVQSVLGDDCIIDYDFMDTKNTIYDDKYTKYYNLLKLKLNSRDKYDAVFVGDDDALHFAMMYKDEFFKDIPIAFTGTDDIESAKKSAKDPYVCGIVESLDLEANIELAMQMRPKSKKFVFIVDDTKNGIGIKQQLSTYYYMLTEKGYEYEILNSRLYSQDELEVKLSQIDDNSIVFLFSMMQKKDGTIYTVDESVNLYEEFTNSPAFRVTDASMGKGLLGGYIIDHYECAVESAQMIKKYFEGSDFSKFNVIMKSPHYYYFDQSVIDKYKLNKTTLPEDTVYINKKASFLQKYNKQIIIMSCGLVFLTIIIALALFIWQQRKYSVILEDQNKVLENAKKQAEFANNEKSEFLLRMSHDIRTPLNVIINMSKMVIEEIDNKDAICSYMNKINSMSQFLFGLLNDILDVSKLESGNIELKYEEYSKDEFVADMLSMIQPLCEKKNIELIFALDDVNILVDKVRFKQIFFNLLTNAVKYTNEGGKIEVLSENFVEEDGYAKFDIYVKDNGIGMSQEFQKKMFKPFTQESNKVTSNMASSGLGLTIVKNVVNLLGYSLSVKSELGKGTSFCVHINEKLCNKKFKSEKIKTDFPEPIFYGKKILLVEDHPLNMEIAKRILEKKKMVVYWAKDGQEAIKLFQEFEENFFDAILMDIRMPVIDGLQATKYIRAMNTNYSKKVPIIAMTANAFDEDIQKSLDSGMNAHISKPIDPQVLYQNLCSVFFNREY